MRERLDVSDKILDMTESGSGVDPQMAEALLHEGATLVFLDVPQGTEFGIDYNSWTVGPRFKGVKMIPPGIHFIYFSAVSSTKDVAPRTGFFHNFSKQEVLIKHWDKLNEGLKTEPVNTDPEVLQQNRREFDRFLAPYPYESYRKWVSLTSHLTPRLLSRLQPLSGVICAVCAFQSEGSTTAQRQQMRQEAPPGGGGENKLPEMKVVPGTELRFTKIPEKKYPENATPAEITAHNLDHTYVLQHLQATVYDNDNDTDTTTGTTNTTTTTTTNTPTTTTTTTTDSNLAILGEIQFAFVCFLLGQNYEAFEQWKVLVHLLCWCERGVTLDPDLYSAFMAVLHHQVNEIPEDFFVDIVTAENFLTRTLHVFFSNVENVDAGDARLAALRTRGIKFRENLQRKFKWDFTEEPDDDAPVVVE